MMYEDNSLQFALIISRKLHAGRQANVLCHLIAGLLAKFGDLSRMEFTPHPDANGTTEAHISKFPVIVLSAKNGNQLRTLRQLLDEQDLPHNTFYSQMLGVSAQEQLAQTATTPEEDLEYWGLATFGPKESLNPLLKKFSLYTGQSAEPVASPSK